ncbi:hypothetical protein ACIQGZ_16990 [Streptomyces sp. NPDC092296]|uniref:hypothetical protein n=1 Tax=Streptomyces sp. NPDC092296 TaxID=3366012 RepID=UPI00380E2D27
MGGSYNPVAGILWTLSGSGLGTTLAASGSSGPIGVGDMADLWLAVTVDGDPEGDGPTLDVGVDVQDADGNWYPVAGVEQLVSDPGGAFVSVGLHMPGAAAVVLPQWCRVSWTLGGADPAYPGVSISLYGR